MKIVRQRRAMLFLEEGFRCERVEDKCFRFLQKLKITSAEYLNQCPDCNCLSPLSVLIRGPQLELLVLPVIV